MNWDEIHLVTFTRRSFFAFDLRVLIYWIKIQDNIIWLLLLERVVVLFLCEFVCVEKTIFLMNPHVFLKSFSSLVKVLFLHLLITMTFFISNHKCSLLSSTVASSNHNNNIDGKCVKYNYTVYLLFIVTWLIMYNVYCMS